MFLCVIVDALQVAVHLRSGSEDREVTVCVSHWGGASQVNWELLSGQLALEIPCSHSLRGMLGLHEGGPHPSGIHVGPGSELWPSRLSDKSSNLSAEPSLQFLSFISNEWL